MMRPSGRPPTPSARSMAREPVESVSIFILALLPRRMIEPSPNSLLIEDSASSMFVSRTWAAGAAAAFVSVALAGEALDMGKGWGLNGGGGKERFHGCIIIVASPQPGQRSIVVKDRPAGRPGGE